MENEQSHNNAAPSGLARIIKANGLYAVVFLTGAAILVIEILAVRILSPYFGNTIFTVSSVISVILAALSLGYYFGGRTADRWPSHRLFFLIILTSGLLTLGLRIFINLWLPWVAGNFSIIYGPLISSIIMFLVPSFLLGTLSPFTIKLQMMSEPSRGIGTISGKIFFWSTFGSILGSLATGFVLIPRLGIDSILNYVAWLLILIGGLPLLFIGRPQKNLILSLVAVVIAANIMAAYSSQLKYTDPRIIYQYDGVYQNIAIVDEIYNDRPARFMFQDINASSGIYLDGDDLLSEYSQFTDLYEVFIPEAKNFLVIGAAAYTIPNHIINTNDNAQVDVVDIEPDLLEISQQYFGISDSDRMHNYVDDGRRFLKNSPTNYDMIFGDAYFSLHSVPSHLNTVEFFELVKEKLSPNGIFVANIIGSLNPVSGDLLRAQIKTFQSVFPESSIIAVKSNQYIDTQNFIFISRGKGGDFELPETFFDSSLASEFGDLGDHVVEIEKLNLGSAVLLTDDFAPVDYLAAKFQLR